MNPGTIAAITYGILAVAGGIWGYAKVQSKPSLISGLVSGLLLIVGAVLQLQGVGGGLVLSAVVTAALVVVFTIRLVKTRKLMPAGLMLAAGLVALIVMLIGFSSASLSV